MKTVRFTESELTEEIKRGLGKFKRGIETGRVLSEGVHYNEELDSFLFDFESDDETDIISLKRVGHKIQAFNNCFYYGYGFDESVDSIMRSVFIHSLKFPDGRISQQDLKTFVVNAVNSLDSAISLPKYDLIVYPESMSEMNREMLKYLNRLAVPEVVNMELIKELPSKIEFDYDRFKLEVLEAKLPNGRSRYTELQKKDVLKTIGEMMDSIHQLTYFSIARDVKKAKYRQYIKRYYTFKNDDDRKVYESIQNSNVLVIDDIVTSGTTLSHILKCLRSVNDSNNIVVFSLIGKTI